MIKNPFSRKTKTGSAKKQVKTEENCRVVSELLKPNGVDQSWRVFSILSEFVSGFNLLRKLGPAATFWGSARLRPGDKYYNEAEELATRLAKKGMTIVTGGGGGIMEAGNVGAYKVGGQSVGLNIRLPMEQKLNPYTTLSQTFDHFFARKVMLAFSSEVYIYFPGGFGTMDELFEILTLIQTEKISRVPVILYGKDFWQPLIAWMKDELLNKYHTIDTEDLKLFTVVNSVNEAEKVVLANLTVVCEI